MSEGNRIPLQQAKELAQKVIEIIRPACARVEVAGSVRRQKPDVGDIEIVCVPEAQTDLFSNRYIDATIIESYLKQEDYEFTKNGEHFKQFNLGPCMCDLFITTRECWGVIFAIRTGPADFSHRLVTQRNLHGLLPSYLKIKDGRVWNGSKCLDTPEETDFFRVADLKWIEPKDRK